MGKLLKKVLVLFIFVLFAGLIVQNAHAQTSDPPPAPDPTLDNPEFTTDPPAEDLTGEYVNISIIFAGLQEDKSDYRLCTGSTKCLDDKPMDMSEISRNIVAKDGKTYKTYSSKVSLSSLDFFTSDGQGIVKIKVCGDGKERVKVEGACKSADPAPSKATGDGDGDYFWSGNTYYVGLGVVNDEGTKFTPLKKGGFFVQYAYPKFEVISKNPVAGGTLQLSLVPPKLNGGSDRTNYKISITGGEGYDQNLCLPKSAGKTGKDNIWQASGSSDAGYTIDFNKITVGKYTIRLEDQNKDNRSFLGLQSGGLLEADCSGGFDYTQIICDIPQRSKGAGSCSEPVKDPKGEEYKAFAEDLAELNRRGVAIKIPCGDGKTSSQTNPGQCPEIITAIGPVSVDSPQSFIETLFKYILMIASFAGTIIIIYAGYVFMTSRGDKEKIAGARDTLTSAIVGLLFIVLSIVILEIIGVDILRIPGLGR
jgi:hypothetical protein